MSYEGENPRVTIRLPRWILELVDATALKLHVSRSFVIRRILEQKLRRFRKNELYRDN